MLSKLFITPRGGALKISRIEVIVLNRHNAGITTALSNTNGGINAATACINNNHTFCMRKVSLLQSPPGTSEVMSPCVLKSRYDIFVQMN